MRIESMLCPAMLAGAAVAQMRAAWDRAPDWLWVQHSADQPAKVVGAAFAAAFPGSALHLATAWPPSWGTCPATIGPGGAIGALGLWDDGGDYATAEVALGCDVRAAARAALAQALDRAGRPGEVPDLVWVSASAGAEDLVQAELSMILGGDTPIHGTRAGGTCVPGRSDCDAALVVSVLFPGCAAGPPAWSGPAALASAGWPWASEPRLPATRDTRNSTILGSVGAPGLVSAGSAARPAAGRRRAFGRSSGSSGAAALRGAQHAAWARALPVAGSAPTNPPVPVPAGAMAGTVASRVACGSALAATGRAGLIPAPPCSVPGLTPRPGAGAPSGPAPGDFAWPLPGPAMPAGTGPWQLTATAWGVTSG